MTHSHPTQTVRGVECAQHARFILSLWREGKSDTLDLARQFRIPEHQVYAIIANKTDAVPDRMKIGYAGRPLRGEP